MRRLVFVLLACLLWAMTGCGNQSTSPEPLVNTPTTEEAMPAEVNKLLTENAPPEDEPLPEFDLEYITPFPYDIVDNCDIYSVTFLWGDFFNLGISELEPMDWSGTLSVNGVAVVHPRFTIDFEPGQDWLVPTNVPSMSAWVSQTSADFDGISFMVFMQRGIEYFAAPMLTFKTEQIEISLDFHQLIKYAAWYPVGETAGVAVLSRLVWQNACPGGLIDGKWTASGLGSGEGTIEGVWYDRLGEPFGLMSGRFWTNEDYTREFAGSLSGYVTDQVLAEYKGKWYYNDIRLCPMCGEGHGIFRGRFVFLADGVEGTLSGTFGDYTLSVDQAMMPMIGRWRVDCPIIVPDDICPWMD